MSKPDGRSRGFAVMDPDVQREIASKGGRTAHAQGAAHQFTSEEAEIAGRKGGPAVSRDRQHMREIGRRGGLARGKKKAEPKAEGEGGRYLSTIRCPC